MAIRTLVFALIVAGCSRTTPTASHPEPLVSAPRNHLVIAESDYQTGLLELIDLTKSEEGTSFPIHSDAVARAPQGSGSIFVLNRYLQDSILVLGEDLLAKKSNYSVGAESNPQDILWVNEKLALVSRLQAPEILFLNPTTGQEVGEKISLANFADSDGNPEMAWMAKDGSNIAIELQRLTKFVPSDFSSLAVLDIETKALRIKTLACTNPVTEFKQGPNGEWYVGEAGYMGLISKLDCGIERLEKGTFSPQGLIIGEQALGGDIVDFEVLSDSVGIAIVASPESQVVSFDPRSGQKIGDVLPRAPRFQYQQLLLDRPRKLFYMSDRDPLNYGVRVFSMETLEEIPEARRYTKLPPYQMSWMD